MSDSRLRLLERCWRETGTAEDGAAYLHERLRAGDLTKERLWQLACLGDDAAVLALGEDGASAHEVGWRLWYRDLFDRDMPQLTEADGTGCRSGFSALWTKVLSESVDEMGCSTFSRFHLRWVNDALSAWSEIPFEGEGMQRLKLWSEDDSGLIPRLADAHVKLLAGMDGCSFSDAAAQIAALAEQAQGLGLLKAQLRRL